MKRAGVRVAKKTVAVTEYKKVRREEQMQVEYIRNLSGSYMIIKDADFPYENAELLMLLNNQIPGLLDVQIIISNGKMEYWYDITGMTSLHTLTELSLLNGQKFRRMIEDIYDMSLQVEDYMLDGENVAFMPEFVYFDRGKGTYQFCYLPGIKSKGEHNLQSLSEYLLTKIDHKDPDAVKMGYDFYEKTLQECCSARELLTCIVLKEEKQETMSVEDDFQTMISRQETAVEKEVLMKTMQAEEAAEPEKGKLRLWKRKGRLSLRKKEPEEKSARITETDYAELLQERKPVQCVAEPIPDETPTVFLNMDLRQEPARLIYQGNGKEDNFMLEEALFLIGKDADKVQAIINADTVSRIHAKIYWKEDSYYIEDLNSTNGTYVNGKELFYKEPVRLQKEDRIFFATEEYLFC